MKGTAMELFGKKINFLGDSITEGCCATTPELGYVEVMKQLYGLQKVRNYGIGGTRIARQTKPSEEAKFDLDFCMRYKEMDPDTDIVVVFGGTNDHGHGDAPIGIISDRTPDTFYGACHVLFSGLLDMFPEAQIVILTPLRRTGDCDPKMPGGTILSDYANAIRETAAFYQLPILDLFCNSNINTRLSELTTDGLHPNDKGHGILAREIGSFLQSL